MLKINKTKFGNLADGREVSLFILENSHGIKVAATHYGAIITSIYAPDRNGDFANVVCGFDKLEHYTDENYLSNYPYLGAVCGRVANRIAKGLFTLEGKEYHLAINNGPNHLHGGKIGFDRRLWNPEMVEEKDKVSLKLTYLSPDGEENYPGNLKVTCIYLLNDDNELTINYSAETDKTTILNLTNHTYFNLTGGKEKIMEHELRLAAEKFTEADDMIPTGNIADVKGTPFDFTEFKALGKDFDKLETGYDLNYVLDNEAEKLIFAGCLREKKSGRQVEVRTTQPGIQLYTGYWIPELEIEGKKCLGSYAGVALETQHYPDSINHPEFPSVILSPGEKFNSTTIYKFSAE